MLILSPKCLETGNVGILTSQINIETFISIILPLQSWLMVAPII